MSEGDCEGSLGMCGGSLAPAISPEMAKMAVLGKHVQANALGFRPHKNTVPRPNPFFPRPQKNWGCARRARLWDCLIGKTYRAFNLSSPLRHGGISNAIIARRRLKPSPHEGSASGKAQFSCPCR
jgi:hypothetical protein